MSGRTATVLGLGMSGAACARVLAGEGWHVIVTDGADGPAQRATAAALPPGIEVRLGDDGQRAVEAADMVCPSPGVDWRSPLLERARQRGVPVRSELALVFERCPAPIAGVTGTNGKTTTTALLGAVLAPGGHPVHVGGNIGETMLDRLDAVAPDDWVVLELSSFQLESVPAPRCRLATVLNLSPDHLDRHGTMEAYAAIKARVVAHADPAGTVALNAGDPVVRAMAASSSAPVTWFGRDLDATARRGDHATVSDGRVTVFRDGTRHDILDVAEIPLLGGHNVDNVLAACALAVAAGVDDAGIADAVRAFRPVAHRLQPVADVDGVLWVNDSKATNVDAAVTALGAMGDRPIVWIGGGGRKGVGPEELCAAVAARAWHAILNGATGPECDSALAALGMDARTLVGTLAEAVRAAHDIARPGDVVLLAPGYTSFDQFRSYGERGDAFAALVAELTGPVTPAPTEAR